MEKEISTEVKESCEDRNEDFTEIKDSDKGNFNFIKFKEYAENHTSLVIGLTTLLISAVSLYLNLCMYAYKLGYYNWFGVNVSTVSFMSSDSLLQILFLLVIATIILFFNLVGYVCYTKRKFLIYFSIFFLIVYTATILCFVPIYDMQLLDCIQIAFLLLIFVAILHTFTISIMLSFPKDALIMRKGIKLAKLKDRYLKYDKLIKDVDKEKQLSKLENKKQKISNNIITKEEEIAKSRSNFSSLVCQYKDKISNNSITVALIVFAVMLSFIIAYLYLNGYTQAHKLTQIETVDNLQNVYLSDVFNKKELKYAVIFKNEEYCIVSPCVEKNDVDNIDKTNLIVYNEYQIKIDSKGQLFNRKKYNKIEKGTEEFKIIEGESDA